MRKKGVAVLAVLGMAGLLWANAVSGNALSCTATSGTVYFGEPHGAVAFTNDGANEVYVKVWLDGQLDASGASATITTTSAGVRKINPGETWILEFEGPWEGGGAGYKAFSHICDTAETTTLRYFAK